MISAYLPTPDLQAAPAIVQRLRAVFDEMMESLHATATLIQVKEREHATKMIHVPFVFEQFDVEAMYDVEQDLFTQLVARPGRNNENDRPPYTISLFLVGHHHEVDEDEHHFHDNAD